MARVAEKYGEPMKLVRKAILILTVFAMALLVAYPPCFVCVGDQGFIPHHYFLTSTFKPRLAAPWVRWDALAIEAMAVILIGGVAFWVAGLWRQK